jgi:hypothetical protein
MNKKEVIEWLRIEIILNSKTNITKNGSYSLTIGLSKYDEIFNKAKISKQIK